MKYLGFSRLVRTSVMVTSLMAIASASVSGCKGSGGGDDNVGGDGGGVGGSGGDGGDGGTAGGMAGTNAAGMNGGGMMGGMAGMMQLPPPPEPVIEDYAAPTATLPVTLDFKNAADFSGKLFSKGTDITQSGDSGGVLKVTKGKAAVVTYDTTPDEVRTDTFESFTATVKFHATRLVDLWFTFATDKNRNDGMTINFGVQHGKDGPPGVSDVDSIYFNSKCWAPSIAGRGPQCIGGSAEAYGWTAFEPSSEPQTLKITVRADKDAKTIKARGEYIDAAGTVIDAANYDWVDVPRVNGELSIGLYAADSDAFIDEITIKEAEAIPDNGVVTLEDSPIHLWIPTGLAASSKLKGLIVVTPNLTQTPNGEGDFGLFDHFRRFATAYGWGVVSGVRSGPGEFAMYFKSDLAQLATKTGRTEINTVPVFVHSLLNMLPYQALSDDEFNKRLIGFFADKPRPGGDLNAGMEETTDDYPISAAGRAIPGFITYSQTSLIARRNSGGVTGFWWANRFFGAMAGASTDGFALWHLMGHNAQTHAVVDTWFVYLAFLQEAIAMRTTNNDGTTALKPVDKSKAYLGYSEFMTLKFEGWAPSIEPFLPSGYPPAGAAGDQLSKPTKEYLLGPSTALVWQAFEYYKQKTALEIIYKQVYWNTVPKHGKVGDSRIMKLGIDPALAGWKKIEFFDSASATPMTPVKVVNAGEAPEHTYQNLSLGAHNFIARLTDKDDQIHFAHPVMAIFTP